MESWSWYIAGIRHCSEVGFRIPGIPVADADVHFLELADAQCSMHLDTHWVAHNGCSMSPMRTLEAHWWMIGTHDISWVLCRGSKESAAVAKGGRHREILWFHQFFRDHGVVSDKLHWHTSRLYRCFTTLVQEPWRQSIWRLVSSIFYIS